MWVKTQDDRYIDINNFRLRFFKGEPKEYKIVSYDSHNRVVTLGSYVYKRDADFAMDLLKSAIKNNYNQIIIM